MSPVLARLSRRHLAHHPLQVALAVLGVGLGVAVVVAIELANGSALEAFELSSEAVIGKATHQIVGGPAGVAEEVFVELRRGGAPRPSAPVVEGYVSVDGRSLRLLGVDALSERAFRAELADDLGGLGGLGGVDLAVLLTRPGSVLMSPETAARLGVEEGGELEVVVAGRAQRVRSIGWLGAGERRRALDDLLVADIATAQELLGLEGRLTRIDLIVPEDGEAEALERLASALPAGVAVEPASRRAGAARDMTRAFRLNLRALSLLALLCGAFLIYNTITFAVVQRRRLFGVLRALGATRWQIFGLVLGEALVIGVVGAVLGIAGGTLLGRGLIDQVTRTINDLYFVVSVRSLELSPATLWRGLALGVGGSLIAALAPAVEATSAAARSALERAELEGRARRAVPRAAGAGLLLLAAAAGLLGLGGGAAGGSLPAGGLGWSFAGLFAMLVGFALLTPAGTVALTALLTPVAGRLFGQLGRLAARGVVAALSRTAVAVGALVIAVSVAVAVDLMIRSFRQSVEQWLDYSLPADLYLSAAGGPTGGSFGMQPTFEPEVARRLATIPGVVRVNRLRHGTVETGRGRARLVALDLDHRSHDAFVFLDGRADEVWPAFESGRAVIVSEPYAHRTGLGAGDAVELSSPAGRRELPVAGVYRDYSSELGTVMIARERYLELWQDPALSAISLHLDPTADGAAVADAVRTAAGGERLVVRSTRELRRDSLSVFDRTFLVTATLRLLAVAVAFVGVLSALAALELERARELGVLRALGLTPGQVWRVVGSQTALMGVIAGVMALPVGVAAAAVMVYVINRRSFGWSVDLLLAPEPLLGGVLVALAAALAAGVYPAARMARTSPAEALRGE